MAHIHDIICPLYLIDIKYVRQVYGMYIKQWHNYRVYVIIIASRNWVTAECSRNKQLSAMNYQSGTIL